MNLRRWCLYTSSYALVAGGYALLAFAAVFWITDIKRFTAWTPPLVAYGMNCIFVYVASHVVGTTLRVIRTGSGEQVMSLHDWINIHWFQCGLSPANASLAFALLCVGFWWIPLRVMARRGIFIKV